MQSACEVGRVGIVTDGGLASRKVLDPGRLRAGESMRVVVRSSARFDVPRTHVFDVSPVKVDEVSGWNADT